MSPLDAEAVDLLQRLIRNKCVNDGTPSSGHETRNAELLRDFFAGSSLDVDVYEPSAGRGSIVARLEGRVPTAPTLLLLSHLDVVSARSEGWRHDPFAGDFEGGFVWGRGAIDMLGTVATMACAVRRLASDPSAQTGTVIFVGSADEEAGGALGVQWLFANHPEAIAADCVLTEWGGVPVDTPAGTKLWVNTGEKGRTVVELTVKGRARHASRPFESDNPIITAAEIIRRIGNLPVRPQFSDTWHEHVRGMGFDAGLTKQLLAPATFHATLQTLSSYLAQRAHALTHTTYAPTIISGGMNSNVIPDRVTVVVDIRTLPGNEPRAAIELLTETIGDLSSHVDVSVKTEIPGSMSSAVPEIWQAVVAASAELCPGAQCIPSWSTGTSDARFFRDAGVPAYGFGLYSRALSIEEFGAMFHGIDERIDSDSLSMSTELWQSVARRLGVSDIARAEGFGSRGRT